MIALCRHEPSWREGEQNGSRTQRRRTWRCLGQGEYIRASMQQVRLTLDEEKCLGHNSQRRPSQQLRRK